MRVHPATVDTEAPRDLSGVDEDVGRRVWDVQQSHKMLGDQARELIQFDSGAIEYRLPFRPPHRIHGR